MLCCASSREEPRAREHPQLRHVAEAAIPARAIPIPCSPSSTGCHPWHSPRTSLDVTSTSQGTRAATDCHWVVPSVPGGRPWAGALPELPQPQGRRNPWGAPRTLLPVPHSDTSVMHLLPSSQPALIRGWLLLPRAAEALTGRAPSRQQLPYRPRDAILTGACRNGHTDTPAKACHSLMARQGTNRRFAGVMPPQACSFQQH